MHVTLKIGGVDDIDSIIGILREERTIYSKQLKTQKRTIAVFFCTTKAFRWIPDFPSMNTVLDYNQENRRTVIDIIPLVPEEGSIAQFGTIEKAWKELVSKIQILATSRNWDFELVRPDYRGVKCAHYKAVYSYRTEERTTTGRVVCKNCGKEFRLDEDSYPYGAAERKETKRGEKCPFCGGIYVYKERHLLEDGAVKCQNCGEKFMPDEDLRFSHRTYSEYET